MVVDAVEATVIDMISAGEMKISLSTKSNVSLPVEPSTSASRNWPDAVVPAESFDATELPAVIVTPASAVVPDTVVQEGEPPIVAAIYMRIVTVPLFAVDDAAIECNRIIERFVTPL